MKSFLGHLAHVCLVAFLSWIAYLATEMHV